MLSQCEKKPSLQEKLADFESACKAAGLKLTHQRLEIYHELAIALDHPSAETVYQRLKQRMPTISLDTIYRTLTTFERHGLIRKVHTAESQARFEAQMLQHHHLICDKCRQIIDFQWPVFDESSLPEAVSQWGQIRHKNVVLHGICDKCLQSG